MDNCPELETETIDATGKMVFPSWCDSHTHLVYAGSREQEFVDRINGLTYEEITERGGGIHNSAKRLQNASEKELYESAMVRLAEIIGFGTGSVEIKSGYGLTTESELKMLRVAKRIKENTTIPIKITFLGAHAIPLIYKENRRAYIDLLINEMLPKVVEENLADYCDVFCEKGFFTMEETDEVLKAAAKLGLKSKIHANELYYSGGVQVGVANNAISVDHLECVGEAEITALKGSNTMPTILPSTAFFLSMEYAPARMMIDAGLPVALASDYNPGSTPSGRMSFNLSLACLKMDMTPEEAINAATINGAFAMELQDKVGTITKGKLANVFITKPIPSVAFIPYSFGSDLVETVILNGKIVK
jgi:imidazolonepropionase